jgi:hypothetical protein
VGNFFSLALCGGHERILGPLLAPLLLLLQAVRGAFTSVLIPLGLASGMVKNCSNHFLARSVVDGNVKELLGSPWVLVPQLVDQGLIGGP